MGVIVDLKKIDKLIAPDNWSLMDYIKYAVEHHGYELILIWGEQGSGKSNLMLQLAYKVFGNWETVFEHLIFTPKDLIEKAENLQFGWKYSMLLWDDVGVHFPSTKFRTDPETYEKVAEFLDAHRTIASVIICTAPNWLRYPKVLRDNCTIEIYVARSRENPMYSFAWAYRHLKALEFSDNKEVYFFKKEVQEPFLVKLDDIPREVWEKYWNLRLNLCRESLINLKKEIMEEEEYIDIYTASEKTGIPIETLDWRINRGLLKAKRIGGLVHIEKRSLEKYLNYSSRSKT